MSPAEPLQAWDEGQRRSQLTRLLRRRSTVRTSFASTGFLARHSGNRRLRSPSARPASERRRAGGTAFRRSCSNAVSLDHPGRPPCPLTGARRRSQRCGRCDRVISLDVTAHLRCPDRGQRCDDEGLQHNSSAKLARCLLNPLPAAVLIVVRGELLVVRHRCAQT